MNWEIFSIKYLVLFVDLIKTFLRVINMKHNIFIVPRFNIS